MSLHLHPWICTSFAMNMIITLLALTLKGEIINSSLHWNTHWLTLKVCVIGNKEVCRRGKGEAKASL